MAVLRHSGHIPSCPSGNLIPAVHASLVFSPVLHRCYQCVNMLLFLKKKKQNQKSIFPWPHFTHQLRPNFLVPTCSKLLKSCIFPGSAVCLLLFAPNPFSSDFAPSRLPRSSHCENQRSMISFRIFANIFNYRLLPPSLTHFLHLVAKTLHQVFLSSHWSFVLSVPWSSNSSASPLNFSTSLGSIHAPLLYLMTRSWSAGRSLSRRAHLPIQLSIHWLHGNAW